MNPHRWTRIETKRSELDLWPRPRSGHTATTLRNTNGNESVLLLFGGRHKDGRCNELLYLDAETLKWTQPLVSGKLPSPRKTHSAAAVGSRFFMLGGHDGDRPLGQVVHVLEIANLIKSNQRKLSVNVPVSTLTTDFGTILNAENSLSDISFIVEGRPIRLHRAILGARCEYFKKVCKNTVNSQLH